MKKSASDFCFCYRGRERYGDCLNVDFANAIDGPDREIENWDRAGKFDREVAYILKIEFPSK